MVLPQDSSGSLERNQIASYVRRRANHYLDMWSPDSESGEIYRSQRRLLAAHVLEHIGLRTYCLSEVTPTWTSGLFLQKFVRNDEGADE